MGGHVSTPVGYTVAALLGAVSYHAVITARAQRKKSGTHAASDAQRDQDIVREAYHQTVTGSEQGCCQVVQGVAGERIGYSEDDLAAAGVSDTTTMLGCGTPVEVAQLSEGETVMDLGCGAGVDCFIAARRVGASGTVIGVDMTPSMLTEARSTAARLQKEAEASGSGIATLSFRLGEIEHLPVGDDTVDCIISNCVINLSPDKQQVYSEMFRALRPGGRIAISDVLKEIEQLPDHLRTDQALAC